MSYHCGALIHLFVCVCVSYVAETYLPSKKKRWWKRRSSQVEELPVRQQEETKKKKMQKYPIRLYYYYISSELFKFRALTLFNFYFCRRILVVSNVDRSRSFRFIIWSECYVVFRHHCHALLLPSSWLLLVLQYIESPIFICAHWRNNVRRVVLQSCLFWHKRTCSEEAAQVESMQIMYLYMYVSYILYIYTRCRFRCRTRYTFICFLWFSFTPQNTCQSFCLFLWVGSLESE